METRGGWTEEACKAHANWKGKAVVAVSGDSGEGRGESGTKEDNLLRSHSSNQSVSGFGSIGDVEKLPDNIDKTDLMQKSGDEKDPTSKGDALIEIPVILNNQQEGKTKDRGCGKDIIEMKQRRLK